MREDWEYKKLEDISSSVLIEKAKKRFSPNDVIRYIDISSIDNINQCLTGTTSFKMLDAPSRAQQKVEYGDILISTVRPNLRNIAIVNDDTTNLVASSGFCVLRINDAALRRYVFYYVVSNKFTAYLEKLTNGANYPAVKETDVRKALIPIPPKPTQLSIVTELDKLNELIRIKKEQLKDYDALAQSIFYEMFGDPVVNEKGWEVKKLMEVCDVRDGTHDSPKYVESSNYMLITSKNIVNRAISFDDVNYITEEDYNNINKRSKVDNGDILMPMIGTIGNPVIVYLDNLHKFSIKNVALIKFLHNTSILNRYLLELMISESFRRYLLSLNKGGTQKFVALGTIRRMDIILPPLPLQHSFAQKIEQIERQKAAVQSTITDLETLLAARMQYWFD